MFVLQQQAASAMQHAGHAPGKSRGVFAVANAAPSRLNTDQVHTGVRDKGVEDPHRVTATTHAGHDGIGQTTGVPQHLRAGLGPDHRLKLAHHQRVWMRPKDRPQHVRRGGHIRHPVAHRFVDRILQRAAAAVHRRHRGAQHPHAEHVQGLARDVVGAHVDDALQPEERTGRGGRHPVLAGAGFRNHPGLPHPARQQHLSHGVVDLVRAGMGEVLALEEHTNARLTGEM